MKLIILEHLQAALERVKSLIAELASTTTDALDEFYQNLEDLSDEMVKSITVGTVTTGEPGTDADVQNSGTEQNVVLDFTIPRGDKGEQGESGIMLWEYVEQTESLHLYGVVKYEYDADNERLHFY